MSTDPVLAMLDLLRQNGVKDERVLRAMAVVPRERFVPPPVYAEAYADSPLPISCGQTISQPLIVAIMTEALGLTGGERVLEIGTGSGYQTAILARLARAIVSVERHLELAERARRLLGELGYDNVVVNVGDGTLGWPPDAPYDAVIVTAAAPGVPPSLVTQLAEGGRLVIPVGSRDEQDLRRLTRRGDGFAVADFGPCRFVPLVGAEGWREE